MEKMQCGKARKRVRLLLNCMKGTLCTRRWGKISVSMEGEQTGGMREETMGEFNVAGLI